MASYEPLTVLERTLCWSRHRNYSGWDYSDGMSSRILKVLPFESRLANLFVQEIAKRFPLNIRPLLLIPRRRNFKGTALYIQANLTAFEHSENQLYLQEASKLGQWLLAELNTEPFGWGHNHRLQTLNGIIPRNDPAIVTVVYGCRALLRLHQYRHVDVVSEMPDRVLQLIKGHLSYDTCPQGARFQYWASHHDEYYVLNANALGATLLMELSAIFDRPDLRELAEPVLDYVISKQTEIGGWHYADPPSASHLSMDNHHNGFIIESLLRCREITGSTRYDRALERGLRFYREQLFEKNGAPCWDEQASYPRDIHAAAQGIITFSLSGEIEFAHQILDWTLQTLYSGEGRFWYRQDRMLTRKITLMRWSQAWMAAATAVLLDGPSATLVSRQPRGLSVGE